MKKTNLFAALCLGLAFGLAAPGILSAESGIVFDQSKGTVTGPLVSGYAISASSMAVSGAGVAGSDPLVKVAGSTLTVLNNGNVGIGTAAPGFLLDVQGTISAGKTTAGGEVRIEGKGGTSFPWHLKTTSLAGMQFTSDSGNTNVTFLDTGNVGIGTAVPGAKLQLGGQTEDGLTYMYFGKRVATPQGNLPFIGHASLDGAGNDLGLGAWSTNGGINLYTGNAAPFSPESLRMRISVSGNVGISTGAPQARLDVLGAGSTPATMTQIWRNSGGTVISSMSDTGVMMATKFIGDGSNITGVSATDNTKVLKAGDTMTGALHLSSTTISPSSVTLLGAVNVVTGKVGIGTADPGYPLDVQASNGAGALRLIGRAADDVSSLSFANSGKTADGYIQGNGSWIRSRADGGFHFAFGGTPVTTDTDGFTIEGMNVGIGTTGPNQKLDVFGAISSGVNDYTYNAAVYQLTNQSRVDGISGTSPTGAFRWYTNPNSSDRSGFLYQLRSYDTTNGESAGLVTFKGDGNVGIGTTSPAGKLQIGALTNGSNGSINGATNPTRLIVNSASGSEAALTLGYYSAGYGLNLWVPANPSAPWPTFIDNINASSGFRFRNNTGAAPVDLMTIDSTGKVGIGTTTPAGILDVFGSNQTAYIRQNPAIAGGATLAITAAGDASNFAKLQIHNATIRANSGVSDLHFDVQTKTDAMVIKNASGNVGIGTTAPGALLHVSSNLAGENSIILENIASSNSGAGSALIFKQGANGYDAGKIQVDREASYSTTATAQDSALAFYTAVDGVDGEKVRITSQGNVGISTGAPQARLDVLGAGSTPATMTQIWRNSGGTVISSMSDTGVMMASKFIGDGSGITGLSGDNLGNHTATTDLNMSGQAVFNASSMTISGAGVSGAGPVFTVAGSTLNVLANGNVGIGRTGPTSKLVVAGSSSELGDNGIFAVEDGNRAGLSFGYDTTNDWSWIYSRDVSVASKPLYMLASEYNLMNGNVGIGTTAPGAKLEVAGDVKASTATFTGFVNVTSTAGYAMDGYTILRASNPILGIFLGKKAGLATTGSYNVFIGNEAGYTNNWGSYNSFLGNQAGYSNTTGPENTFLGSSAGYYNTTGGYNTFVGSQAGLDNTVTANSTFVGYAAGNNNTGSENTAIGSMALVLNTGGSANTATGYQALYSNTTTHGSTANGYMALYSNTTGAGNTATGREALYSNTTGNGNTANGAYALYLNTTGIYNTVSGEAALRMNTTGRYNTVSGWWAGYGTETGSANSIFGYKAGAGVAGNSFSSSTLVGYQAGYALTTGSDNILLGWQAGDNLTTGSRNILLGYDIDTPAAASTNFLSIGNLIFATGGFGTGTTVGTGNVGIGTTAPGRPLHVYSAGANNYIRSDGDNARDAGFTISNAGTDQVYLYRPGTDGAGFENDFRIWQFGDDRLTIRNGNVGIGTTTPAGLLHLVSGTGGADRIILQDTSGTGARGGLIYGSWAINGLVLDTLAGDNATRMYYGSSNGNVDHHHFYSNGVEAMTMDEQGRVGIGTTTPQALLNIKQSADSIYGGLAVLSQDGVSRAIWIGARNDATSRIESGAGGTGALVLNSGGGNVGVGLSTPGHKLHVGVADGAGQAVTIRAYSDDPPSWKGGAAFGYSGASVVMGEMGGVAQIGGHNATLTAWNTLAINSGGGNVGIGTTSPGYKLTVNGTAWVTSGAWSGSDRRWKKNIAPLKGSLDKVLALQGVSYDWRTREFPEMNFSTATQIGLIAQDMENVVPEVVITNPVGYKGISYEKLVPVLIEAIKEQQEQIEELKARGGAVEPMRKSPPLRQP